MKITPIEIKQKSFASKSFGKGYDKEEVTSFLLLLSQEWERLSDENKEQKIRIELLEKEIHKLKEVEGSLFRTLQTAEETSTNMISQARKNAELKVKEAQIKSDAILNEARSQAKNIVQKAQGRARKVLEEMVQEMQQYERSYKDLEHHRENLLLEMRNFMNETLEKVNRFEGKAPTRVFEEKLQEAQNMVEEENEKQDHQSYLDEVEQKIMQASEENATDSTNDTENNDADTNLYLHHETDEDKPSEEGSFFEDLNKDQNS